MSYVWENRVRYSETGEDECLTLNGIINYFQDCSTFHSEDVGLGLDALISMDRGWVLSSWQIVVNRYPKLGEKILVKTWPYGFKGMMGERNFTLESPDGEMLAYAASLWIMMDLKKGRPTRITPETVDNYEMEEKLDMEYAPRKVIMPEGAKEGEAFPVRTYHLDTNHHVNNGQYIQMAREFIQKDADIRQMRAEYKKQARLGDMIVPKVHQETDVVTVNLCDTEGQTYATVEFCLSNR